MLFETINSKRKMDEAITISLTQLMAIIAFRTVDRSGFKKQIIIPIDNMTYFFN